MDNKEVNNSKNLKKVLKKDPKTVNNCLKRSGLGYTDSFEAKFLTDSHRK